MSRHWGHVTEIQIQIYKHFENYLKYEFSLEYHLVREYEMTYSNLYPFYYNINNKLIISVTWH